MAKFRHRDTALLNSRATARWATAPPGATYGTTVKVADGVRR